MGRIAIDGRSGYGMVDVVRAYLLIGARPMGRKSLTDALRIGEATVRTMMRRLKKAGYVKQGTRGIEPTALMRKDFSRAGRMGNVLEVSVKELKGHAVAVVLRSCSGDVRSGVEQRDAGIMHGAMILTFVMKNGELVLPGVSCRPGYAGRVMEETSPKEGDVVLVSTAAALLNAERGAVAAAMETLGWHQAASGDA
jgi:DNA-binding Lrp family transcriptional regulator